MKYRRLLQSVRKLHIWLGIVAAVYLGLIVITGVALNHRQALRLDNRYVSRNWLPSRDHSRESRVRADIAVNSLHSALLLGRPGTPLPDAIAGCCLALIASGFAILAFRRSPVGEPGRQANASPGNVQARPFSSSRRPYLVASSKSSGPAKVLSFNSRR
jgi:hypothetical protein